MSRLLARMEASVQTLSADLVDVIWPRDCCVCGAPGRVLCPGCRNQLHAQTPRTSGEIGHRVPIITSGEYSGVLHDVIWAYKEHRIRSLAVPLGHLLAKSIAQSLIRAGSSAPDLLVAAEAGRGFDCVAIPMSARAHWNRGDDLVGRMLDVAMREVRTRGLPLWRVRALEYRRSTKDQRHLGAHDRWTNVAASLVVRRRSHRPVIIVDDVVTTGATVTEALRAMNLAGVHVHAVVAIARTPLH